MTASREQARYVTLDEWASAASSAGFTVPAPTHLAAIAQSGRITPELQREPRIAVWAPTIEWLVQQSDAGVEHALSNLPAHLVRPGGNDTTTSATIDVAPPSQNIAPPNTAPSNTAPSNTAPPNVPAAEPIADWSRIDALRAWHRDAIDAELPGATSLREQHLRLVANSHVTTAAEIRAIFPPVVAQFADHLAGALGGGTAGATPTADAHRHPAFAAPGGHAEHPAEAAAQPGAQQATPVPHMPAPPEPQPEPQLAVDPDGFAPYEFQSSASEPVPVMLRRRADGAIALTWPTERPGAESRDDEPGDGAPVVVIDRLIASDEYAPYSPDAARLVVATRGTEAVDDLEFGHATRYYQVWRSTGSSIADAKLSQPERYATGELVSPVLDFDLREDEGRVIGQWRVLPGTTRVQVFRIPIQLAAGSSGDPAFRILHDDQNLGGFVDTTADRGQRYLYQVFAEAELDGVARLSAPTNHELLVSSIHEPVRDLSFELLDSDESPMFDLSWTMPPGGQVIVYRTQDPPQPGIERQAVPAAALAQAGLPEERRQSHPIVTEGDRQSMRHVAWPREWTRAYFTTVVMLGDQAYVGNTVRGVRVPKVGRAKLVERVNRQVLTFEWPEGADIVLAFRSITGAPSEVAMQGAPVEISRSDYRELGGLEFPQNSLDSNGCDLHLVSVAFDGGRRVLAAPEVVHYRGLLRLQYQVLSMQQPDGRVLYGVRMRSAVDVDRALGFVLVHNPERLPLTIHDGRAVGVVAPGGGHGVQRRFSPGPMLARATQLPTFTVEPNLFARECPPVGFLRLFVDLPPDELSRVALLDPPVATLRVRPPGPVPMPQGGVPGAPGAPRH